MESKQENIVSSKIATSRNVSSNFINTSDVQPRYKVWQQPVGRKKRLVHIFSGMRLSSYFKGKTAGYWLIEELSTLPPLEQPFLKLHLIAPYTVCHREYFNH